MIRVLRYLPTDPPNNWTNISVSKNEILAISSFFSFVKIASPHLLIFPRFIETLPKRYFYEIILFWNYKHSPTVGSITVIQFPISSLLFWYSVFASTIKYCSMFVRTESWQEYLSKKTTKVSPLKAKLLFWWE